MQFFVISAGTMVPPLLFLLACAAVRRLLPASSAPTQAADPEKAAAPAELEESAPLTVLPGYVLAATSSLPSAPIESVALQRGRPNIASMLARVRCEHADQQEVAVLVAGPEQLYMQVLEACAAHNAGTGAVTSGPTLVCKRLAHKA